MPAHEFRIFSIRNLCSTRQSTYKQLYFAINDEKTSKIANSFTTRNELYLLVLHPILKHVHEVNKLFESNTVDKTKLLEDLSNLIKSVANMIVLPTCRIDPDASIEIFLNPKPNLGYRFERKIAEMIIKKTVTSAEENNIHKREL
ncbi:Hypothetical predicted protein [Octopus vulgaris]|uniref:Uncharacterized protein n=1 Tax=Octopus vulgaris TaxID=6645 RepID=A0AA36B2I1_OCTVU|nr:Hypothetical predicted protein [Octopus vulgaris]